jgi:hypothetical protein
VLKAEVVSRVAALEATAQCDTQAQVAGCLYGSISSLV